VFQPAGTLRATCSIATSVVRFIARDLLLFRQLLKCHAHCSKFFLLYCGSRFISCQLQGKCKESTKQGPLLLFVRVFPRAFGSCLVSLADFPQPLLLDNALLLVGNVHL